MNEWLTGVAEWLDTTGLHNTMQTVEWMVPTVQTIHILAISVVFASSLVLSLRVLNVAGGEWSPAQWRQRLNGWIWIALLVLLASGVMMIFGEPARSLLNFLFQLKMGLLLVAVVALLLLMGRLRHHLDGVVHATGTDRLLAVILVALWLAIIVCGRWIAYS